MYDSIVLMYNCHVWHSVSSVPDERDGRQEHNTQEETDEITAEDLSLVVAGISSLPLDMAQPLCEFQRPHKVKEHTHTHTHTTAFTFMYIHT